MANGKSRIRTRLTDNIKRDACEQLGEELNLLFSVLLSKSDVKYL